jgi:hypothetical protein
MEKMKKTRQGKAAKLSGSQQRLLLVMHKELGRPGF